MEPTTLLYLDDFNVLNFEAHIVDVSEENGKAVALLDSSALYPQGGGQPCDQGVIESSSGKFLVEEVRFVDGAVKHIGRFERGMFSVGDAVSCRVDPERRKLHARIHSAGHLIDKAVAELELPWTPGKGYHFPDGPYDEYGGSLDGVDKEKLKLDIETLCRQYVAKDSQTEVIFMTKQEMREACRYTPDFPEDKDKRARIVVHDGFYMPCGGTPVAKLSEIGEITIRKIKQERGRIRVGYNVG